MKALLKMKILRLNLNRSIQWITCMMVFIGSMSCCFGRAEKVTRPLIDPAAELPQALNDAEIKRLTTAVDRGLKALSGIQLADGSFPNPEYSKPAVTAMAIMAFLSRGHKPGQGEYGDLLDKGVNYILSIQKKSGLFADKDFNHELVEVELTGGSLAELYSVGGVAKSYCHPICMLMLGEVYGLSDPQKSFRIRSAIEKGLVCTLALWDVRKKSAKDDGGFRYFRPYSKPMAIRCESDFSVTSWFAASLRSISNAGFEVPADVTDRLVGFAVRNQNADGGFGYLPHAQFKSTFTMTAAGSLCLALSGKHDHPALKKSSLFLKNFDVRNRASFTNQYGRYYPYYTCYYMTQVSIQLGGTLWEKSMKDCYGLLMPLQMQSGFWKPEGQAANFGSTYSTSMAILALTPPLKLLPIYQR